MQHWARISFSPQQNTQNQNLRSKTATVNKGPPPVESPTFIRAGVLRLRKQPTKKWAVVLILSVLSQGPLRQGAPRCGRPRGGQISSGQTDDIQPKVLIFDSLCHCVIFHDTKIAASQRLRKDKIKYVDCLFVPCLCGLDILYIRQKQQQVHLPICL